MAQPKQEPMRFPQLAALLTVSVDAKVEHLNVALDTVIADAVRRVVRTQAAAGMTLKIAIGPKGAGGIQIKATLARTLPELRGDALSAFVDRTGALVEEDPQQEVFEFARPSVAPAQEG